MDVFGSSEHSLDQKNRVHLPRRYLVKLTQEEREELVLCPGFEGCLLLLTPAAWQGYVAQFTGQGTPVEREDRNFIRMLRALTAGVAVDAQGRILLPENLRRLAAIANEVVINPGDDGLEIWGAERWREAMGSLGSFDEMGQNLLRRNRERPRNSGGPV